jgi:GcrA cell cycle regulator
MLWTAEAIEVLERLALEGRSASVIAAMLGAPSRNAVIGKANRIGIKLNGGGGRAAAAGVTRAPVHRMRSAAVPRSEPAFSRPISRPAVWDRRVEHGGESALAEPEIGKMRKVKFEDIGDHACRWPLGEPRSGEFAYCGLNTAEGQSYCVGHRRMAYQPPKPRPRRDSRERTPAPAIANSWRLA